jgi:hypothetical protein
MGTVAHYLEINVPAETAYAFKATIESTTGTGVEPEIEV